MMRSLVQAKDTALQQQAHGACLQSLFFAVAACDANTLTACIPGSPPAFHMQAKETAARQQPKEVRIMKHLLSMEDPQQRRASLTEAFTPGPEVEVGGQDLLST